MALIDDPLRFSSMQSHKVFHKALLDLALLNLRFVPQLLRHEQPIIAESVHSSMELILRSE
jgi:hypothetical protein